MPLNSTRGAGSAKGFGLTSGGKNPPVDVDYLVIAGGGNGGNNRGGGGGAGGFRTSFPGGTKITLTGGDTYNITVGAFQNDSVFSTVTVLQTHGNQQITLIALSSMPAGITAYFNGNSTIDSAGSVQIVVKADWCAAVGGNYPIVVQALCGDVIHFVSYQVYIRPPLLYTIPTDQLNYDLQVVNGLASGSSQFIVLEINSSVEVKSTDHAVPSYTTGNLDPNSLVCLVNNGDILGRGGDGGGVNFNGGFFVAGGEAGHYGGNAVNLTTRTILQNHGAIYGGGSGGGSVDLAIGTPNIPIIGPITIGFGFCGGGTSG